MNHICVAAYCALSLFAPFSYSQQIQWQFSGDIPNSRFATSMAVGDDGTIYLGSVGVGTTGHGLYAVTATGTKRWFFATDTMVTAAPSIGTNSNVYFGTFGGSLFALNPNGTSSWEYPTGAEHVRGIALASDGTVYCTVRRYTVGTKYRAKLCAINPDGSRRWEFNVPGEAYGSPTINFDGTIYWPAYDKFYAVNPDGTLYWSYPVSEGVCVIGADGSLYLTGRGTNSMSVVIALNPDGLAEWTVPSGSSGLAVGLNGMVYDFEGSAAFSSSGIQLWRIGIPSAGGGVVSADGTAYIPSVSDGRLSAVTMNGGIKWQVVLPAGIPYSPALTPSGTLYVCGPTRLYAVKVPCGLANSPWPMDGHDLKRTGRAGAGSPVCPCLSSIRLAANRGFQFTMVGEIGVNYRIEASTDLNSWEPTASFLASNLVTHFTDPGATNLPFRFYRAVSP